MCTPLDIGQILCSVIGCLPHGTGRHIHRVRQTDSTNSIRPQAQKLQTVQSNHAKNATQRRLKLNLALGRDRYRERAGERDGERPQIRDKSCGNWAQNHIKVSMCVPKEQLPALIRRRRKLSVGSLSCGLSCLSLNPSHSPSLSLSGLAFQSCTLHLAQPKRVALKCHLCDSMTKCVLGCIHMCVCVHVMRVCADKQSCCLSMPGKSRKSTRTRQECFPKLYNHLL